MRFISRTIAVLTVLAELSEASAGVRVTTHRRKDVKNPIQHDRRRHSARLAKNTLDKRQDDTVSADLENDITLYYIDVSVGTPAQPIQLHIDTGSSDMWVNTASSTLCQRNSQLCAQTGTYDSDSSSTYNFVNNFFNVTYADNSGASGPYVTDTVAVSDATLQNFQFGVGADSTSPQGILGIGYRLNEGVVSTSTTLTYANLPLALLNAGIIERAAYSLWLNDLQADEGTILFGGIDANKFNAPLVTLPILANNGFYTEFTVEMTGLGVNGNAGSIESSSSVAALLDSGTSLTYLPTRLASALYSQFDTALSSRFGYAPVPCSLASDSSSIEFTFNGLTISVPVSEMVINLSTASNPTTCAFGVLPVSSSDFAILGDTFLRSAYVVYDLTNNEISMATANFDSSTDNIVAIPSGTGALPSTTPVSSGGGSGTGVTNNRAAPIATAAPVWKYGAGVAAGMAAMAIL